MTAGTGPGTGPSAAPKARKGGRNPTSPCQEDTHLCLAWLERAMLTYHETPQQIVPRYKR